MSMNRNFSLINKFQSTLNLLISFFLHLLQLIDSRGQLLTALGYGLWPVMVLVSEVVQTFVLSDFCYYYVQW